MRQWAWCVLTAGLVGLGCEQAEDESPAEPSVAPARTYPMHIPPSKDESKAGSEETDEAAKVREVPQGKHAVALEFPAASARHVKARDHVDVYVTLDTATSPYRKGEGDENEGFVGMVAASEVEVMANTCDDEVCALTLFMDPLDKLGALSLISEDMHGIHLWVRPPGAEKLGRIDPKSLKEMMVELEHYWKALEEHAKVASKVSRRVAVEVNNPPLAASLIEEGAIGTFSGTFLVEDAFWRPRRGVANESRPITNVSITLLQRVKVDRARREGERVVLELILPPEHAALMAVARHKGARIDFALQNPGDELTAGFKNTSKDLLEYFPDGRVVHTQIRRPKSGLKRTREGLEALEKETKK